ncbi:MAG TPA: guanylate kinase [Burkholderiales bacterium]|jgi:guanylate kinase|nr:guanylate kinase [Burkholderiales bacterium]
MTGNLFIICAPSGAGKTSLVRALLEREPGVRLSISHTTRARRPGEEDGRHYHFITRPQFEQMIERGEFLECAQVHGNMYGTSQGWIREQRGRGSDIVLEIDWQGAQQVRRLIPDAVGIFILPPSPATLRQRLTDRRQDSPEVIERRLQAARGEIAHVDEFDYVIINGEFSDAVEDLVAIVRSARLRLDRQVERHRELINSLK